MKDYQKHLDAFDAHLTLKNFSKATRYAYGCALRQFLVYRLEQGATIDEFTQQQARSYILYRHHRNLAWQTINGDYSALFKFYKQVLNLEWDVDHIPRPRKERSLPTLLSQQSVQKIIEHGVVFKHQVFITFLYATGLRLSEALNLRLADIDGERLQIRIVKGKGAKDRYVAIPEALLFLLRDYFRAYRPKEYLFNGKTSGRPWAQRSAQWAITSARKAAGVLQQASPHVFRNCFATHHLEAGTNLVYLKEQLGHKNLKTTAKYIRLCKRYQLQVNHPIANMKIVYRPTIR